MADTSRPPEATDHSATIDDAWRREAAAFAVIRIIQRDQPDDFESLRVRVQAERQEERQIEIADAWCDSLHLSCDSIQMAALQLALDPNADDMAAAIDAGTMILWRDSRGEIYDQNLPWRPGETKKAFLARAQAHFDLMKELERQSGKFASPKEINQQHLAWLVRFQVGSKPITKIAGTVSQAPKDVRVAIHNAAALLGLELRTAVVGRPRGSKEPQSKHR